MIDQNGNEVKKMEVYFSVLVDVKGWTRLRAAERATKLYHKVEHALKVAGLEVYDEYEVFRDDNGCIVDAKDE